MTWMKKAEDQIDRGHDYALEQDYEIDEAPNPEIVALVDSIVADIRVNLLPQIGMFQGFEVGYVSRLADNLAIFAHGTSSYPVIGLDAMAIEMASSEYGAPIRWALESSIAHELGHAIQEAVAKALLRGDPGGEVARFILPVIAQVNNL